MTKDMTPEFMRDLVRMYKYRLERAQIPKIQALPDTYFGELSQEQHLAHAHYLCDRVMECLDDPGLWGKTNRLLAALQMCFSFAGWYTLKELQNQNRPPS